MFFLLSVADCWLMHNHIGPEVTCTGPAPAILDWYGHCVRVSVNKLGGSGGMLPQEIFQN